MAPWFGRIGMVLLLLVAGVRGAAAQGPPGPVTLDSIAVIGNQRNTPTSIIAASGLVLNQQVNYRQVQRAIQSLFATGQFDDVSVAQVDTAGRTILQITVRERPLLEQWVIRGAEQIDPNTVRGKISVPVGRPVDRAGQLLGRPPRLRDDGRVGEFVALLPQGGDQLHRPTLFGIDALADGVGIAQREEALLARRRRRIDGFARGPRRRRGDGGASGVEADEGEEGNEDEGE